MSFKHETDVELTPQGTLLFKFENKGNVPVIFNLVNVSIRAKVFGGKKYRSTMVTGVTRLITRHVQYNPGEEAIVEWIPNAPIPDSIDALKIEFILNTRGDYYSTLTGSIDFSDIR